MKIVYLSPPAKTSNEADTLRRLPDSQTTIIASNTDRREADVRVPVTRLPFLGSPERWSAALAWMHGLERLELGSVDVVVSMELFSLTSYQAARLAAELGVPHVVLIAEILASNPLNHVPPWRAFLRRSAKTAAGFICLTDLGHDYAVRMGADARLVHTVSPGVDTSAFCPPAPRPTTKEVVFIGELRRDKGVLDVIGACDRATQEEPSLRLSVVGTGRLRADIAGMRESRPWLDLRGHVPRSEVPAVLQNARVFCIAPRSRRFWAEQFGYAAVEAMSCALPVVATRCGAVPDVVPPHNPLVAEGDQDGLARGVLAALGPDGEGWGLTNRAHVLQHYDLHRQTRAFGEVLAGIVG